MTPRQVLKNWIIAFNNADVESIAQLYHDDSTNDHAANESVIGKDAILEMFASEFAVAKMYALPKILPERAIGNGKISKACVALASFTLLMTKYFSSAATGVNWRFRGYIVSLMRKQNNPMCCFQVY